MPLIGEGRKRVMVTSIDTFEDYMLAGSQTRNYRNINDSYTNHIDTAKVHTNKSQHVVLFAFTCAVNNGLSYGAQQKLIRNILAKKGK